MTGDAVAAGIFIVLGILLVLVPRHMLRVNAYVMTKGGAPRDHDIERDNLLVTRVVGLIFLLVGGSILV